MKGLTTILRREIAAYFNSPLAYIFIMAFLVISTSLFLFVSGFFAYPRADMSAFFGLLIPVLCIFIPAITMRSWAEERKENTIEMLCTFPITPTTLVAGKFLAALLFYLTALACTWVLPLMLEILGDPDWGVLVSSYFGAALIGCFYISLGILISGFCRDQVTAFVLSFLACTFVSLAGWDVFVDYMDGTVAIAGYGLGTALKSAVGLTGHFVPFLRGVVELVDVLFFMLWTVVFLFLNGTYLEGRSRPKLFIVYPITVVLCVLISALANLVILSFNVTLVRLDLTENNVYTMSDASKQILARLDVPVQVKLYITRSSKMPTELRDLEREITGKLDELKAASSGKLKWKAYPMEATEILKSQEEKDEEKEKSLEERLLDKGVRPFSVRSMQQDQTSTHLIYSSIGVAYRDKEEEFIPQVLPANIFELEYRLMSIVYKLTLKAPPKIVLFAPVQEVNIPPQLMQMYMQMGKTPPRTEDPYQFVERLLAYEKFDVQRVKLDQQEQMPEEYDALFVINPREVNDRQKWEINRALVEGKPTFMAVQAYRWRYQAERNTISVSKVEENPGMNEILSHYGIQVDTNILMDDNHQPLTVTDSSNPFAQMMGGGATLDIPTHIIVNPSSMNPDISITNRLGPLFYLWGTRLTIDENKVKEAKLDVTTLISSSEKAWTIPPSTKFSEKDRAVPSDAAQKTLAIMVKGSFPNAYPGDEMPTYAPPPPMPGMPPQPQQGPGMEPAPEVTPAEGKLILIGCAQTYNKNFLRGAGAEMLLNAADALTLGEDLIHIRSNRPVDRTITQPEAGTRNLWKFLILALMNIIAAIAGFSRWMVVRQSRRSYRSSLNKKEA